MQQAAAVYTPDEATDPNAPAFASWRPVECAGNAMMFRTVAVRKLKMVSMSRLCCKILGLAWRMQWLGVPETKTVCKVSTQFARVWIGGLLAAKDGKVWNGRRYQFRPQYGDQSRPSPCGSILSHAVHVASCCAILSQEAEKKVETVLFVRFVIQCLPTNIGVAFHDPF